MSETADTGSREMLKRGLRQRHLSMIGLGGIIGAGLFVGSGSVIRAAGSSRSPRPKPKNRCAQSPAR